MARGPGAEDELATEASLFCGSPNDDQGLREDRVGLPPDFYGDPEPLPRVPVARRAVARGQATVCAGWKWRSPETRAPPKRGVGAPLWIWAPLEPGGAARGSSSDRPTRGFVRAMNAVVYRLAVVTAVPIHCLGVVRSTRVILDEDCGGPGSRGPLATACGEGQEAPDEGGCEDTKGCSAFREESQRRKAHYAGRVGTQPGGRRGC